MQAVTIGNVACGGDASRSVDCRTLPDRKC